MPIPTSGSAFRSGYEYDVPVYTTSSGARHLLLMFNYGFGVMDLSNPGHPSALNYEDMLGTIAPRGDGQNYIWSMGVAPDGARAVFSLGPQATPFKAAVGAPMGPSEAFFSLKGDFSAGAATGGTVVQKTGDGRYIAYVLLSKLVAANITTLPTGTLTAGSMPSEVSAFPGGTASTLQLTGNYLSYLSNTSVLILDASNPGSTPPNITSGFTQTRLTLADFGRTSGSPVTLATALDPADSSALYVLVEFAGSGFSLMRVQGSTKTLIGSFPIPTVSGETWDSGYTSALITGGGNVYAFMWLTRTSPSPLFRLFSTTVSSFGSTPGAVDFDPATYPFFSTGNPMRGFGSSDGTVNAYMGVTATAYALSFSCMSPNSPAAVDMTVTNGGTQLSDGATVFLGDTITITPIVSPPPAFRALTDWRFDFDFHQGVPSEDNLSSPRLKAPDLSYPGSGAIPPATITLVGPCDPNVAGTTPGSGAGCWNSVLQNSAFAGGSPDIPGAELAGATKTLSFAFEASNALGSAGARVFSLNWKVPAARLLSSRILLGNAVSSGADGHPSASGFKWYFGSNNAAPVGEQMSQDASCTGATCPHAFPGRGTFNVWLTVPYANGYTTPDCANPCVATGALTMTVTDVVLAFTAPTQLSTSQASFSVVNDSTVSSSLTNVGNGYTYCVKPASQSCQDSEYADLLANGTGPIPTPAAGNYWLRIRFNYSIGGVTLPPAQWTPTVSGVSDSTAWPFTVSPVTPEIRFNCAPGFGCTGIGGITVYTTDVFTAFAYINGGQDNTTPISWSAPGSSQGDGSTSNPVTLSYPNAGTYTLTLNGYGVPKTAIITVKTAVHPPPPLSVSASANPSSANTGTTITFSCSASGGTPGYTYSWSGAVSGSTSSVSKSFSSAGNYSATCMVTDAASHTASATASVTITAPGGGGSVEIRFNCVPGFGCTDVNSTNVFTNDVFTAFAYLNGGQDNSTPISWSAPGASQGNGSTVNGQTFSYPSAGTYTLTLNGYVTPYTATIMVTARSPGGSAILFYTLPPCRLIDTRDPTGQLGGPSLQAGGTRTFHVAPSCGIPAAAKAISVNLAVTGPARSGYLTLYPGDAVQAPLASAISFSANQTRSNNAVLPLASDGSGTINVLAGTGGTVDFILDVNGYFQ